MGLIVWAVAITAITGAPAIHLDGLAERANVRLRGTVAGDHEIGILVDGCARGSVVVSHNYANFNDDTGIKLQNSDGIVVKGNQVAGNGASGIVVDAGSDDNQLLRNEVRQNVTDVSDAGTGNCWKDNSYTTGSVPECP
jgi:parallel beta-helix repeat protein